MAILHEKRKYTYEDYCKLPSDIRAEVLEGELLMCASPNTRHQRISREIEFTLSQWVKEKGLGEVLDAPMDVVLSPYTVLQPDILYISKERVSIITEPNIQGAPDLVVEILSPGDEKRDTVKKKAIYEKFGVKEYWIVDPTQESITLFSLGEKGYKEKGVYEKGQVLESVILPGFTLKLDEVFKV
jgi:Uma2 family endonuclease